MANLKLALSAVIIAVFTIDIDAFNERGLPPLPPPPLELLGKVANYVKVKQAGGGRFADIMQRRLARLHQQAKSVHDMHNQAMQEMQQRQVMEEMQQRHAMEEMQYHQVMHDAPANYYHHHQHHPQTMQVMLPAIRHEDIRESHHQLEIVHQPIHQVNEMPGPHHHNQIQHRPQLAHIDQRQVHGQSLHRLEPVRVVHVQPVIYDHFEQPYIHENHVQPIVRENIVRPHIHNHHIHPQIHEHVLQPVIHHQPGKCFATLIGN